MNEHAPKPRIIVVCGPTAAGKTAVGIELANRFNGEIISADSMQIYRRMDIGTAKPSPDEQRQAVHHLIDVAEPDEDFDAVRFVALARDQIFRMQRENVLPIVAGGTGFYIKALLKGLFDADPTPAGIRDRIKKEAADKGPAVLHQRLAQLDPQAADRIHPHDSYRIVRALETLEASGQPISAHQRRHGFSDQPFDTFTLGMKVERETLYARIDRRVDAMIAAGLLQEVEGLLNAGYPPELKSMQSIGYRHMAAFVTGELSWDEAVRTMKRDTRHYAKRQMTWFGADTEIVWTEPEHVSKCYPQIERFLKR